MFETKCINKIKKCMEKNSWNYVEDFFLNRNKVLKRLELPNLAQAGDGCLKDNKELIQIEIPKLPELKEKLLYIIDENKKVMEAQNQSQKVIITSQDIAQLDKNNKLTTSEVSIIDKIINKIKRFIENKNDYEKWN